jgi:Spy/CpxP family protein refolding chaperone
MRNRAKFTAMIFAVIVAATSWAASQVDQDILGWMSHQLNLTDSQQAKLQPILHEETQKIKAVYDDTSLPGDEKHAQYRQIHQSYQPQIQAILTPEQQKKLAKKKEEYRQRMTEEPWP